MLGLLEICFVPMVWVRSDRKQFRVRSATFHPPDRMIHLMGIKSHNIKLFFNIAVLFFEQKCSCQTQICENFCNIRNFLRDAKYVLFYFIFNSDIIIGIFDFFVRVLKLRWTSSVFPQNSRDSCLFIFEQKMSVWQRCKDVPACMDI